MKNKKSIIAIVLIISLSLFPLKEFLKYKIFEAHDTTSHIARLAVFFESLSQGNLVPRWGGNLNFGYGHPVIMFLYPLQNYLGSLIHFLGIDFVDSIKTIFILAYVLSGLFMYLWVNDFWGSLPGFIAAAFYLFAPYRFVNLYVRGALGEHLCLTFVPLACFAIYRLVKKSSLKYFIMTSLCLAALITAHNAVSLMFLPIIFFYFLSLAKKNLKQNPTNLFLSLALGFCLSAFFWLPAFFEGKYTLRYQVTTPEIFQERYLILKQLFYSPWGYGLAQEKERQSQFTVQVGTAQWLVLALTLVFFGKIKKKLKKEFKLVLITIFSFITACFLMLKNSVFLLKIITVLPQFQFPWRFLSVPVFSASILAASLVKTSPQKLKKFIFIFLLGLTVIPTVSMWKAQGDTKLKDTSDKYFLEGYQGTTETGESTPRWSIRFMESSPPQKIQVVSGEIENFQIKIWLNNLHEYIVQAKAPSQIADNTLYFPGWKVWVNGKLVPIEFQDQNWRGIITFPVQVGINEVKVKFTETKIRLFADLLSLSAIIFISALILKSLLLKKKT